MKRLLGGKELLQAVPPKKEVLKGLIGGTLGIFVLLLLSHYSHTPWIMAPFGATCVLLFAVSASPLAQPRNVIFGHLISAFVGIFFLKFIGESLFSIACAVGIAISLMQIFRCVHPPAGANPLVILLTAQTISYGWNFLLTPVLIGAVSLVVVAWGVNNIFDEKKWPNYWFAVSKTK
ncbi:MAG: HPP family protein [Acinetobacter sp.]